MRRKKLLIAASSVVALLALLVLLGPTLASGFVRGKVEQELGARLNGTVALRSVDLGWFSPQKVEGLTIDGGAEVGKVAVDAQVAEGLLALLRGSDITLSLAGGVETVFGKDGRLGLARIAKPAPASTGPAPAAGGGNPLGTRALRLRLDGISLTASGPDGAKYALEKLEGDVSLVGDQLEVALDALTRTTAPDAKSPREGELSIDAHSRLVFAPTGSADLSRASGSASVSATRISWPTAAGELAVNRLKVDLSKDEPGNIKATADIVARLDGSTECTVTADIALAEAFDAEGRFSIDPADIGATVEARGVPMAALQPFAPSLGSSSVPGARLDLVRDVGDTADLMVSKQRGDRARVEFNSKQVQFTFDGAVAADGSSIERGTVTSRIAARPELLSALGVPEPTLLELAVRAEDVSWRKGDDAMRSFGGALDIELAKPFDLTVPSVTTRIRAQSLRLELDKKLGQPTATCAVASAGRYGATGDFSLSGRAELDLSSRALLSGGLDASARIDPPFIERLSNGAVSAQGSAATLRIAVPELAYIPSDEFSGLRALVARVHAELEGAIAVDGAGTTAAVNDLAIDLSTPRGSTPGRLALGAKVDGAEVRVDEEFGPFPASGALDLAALAPKGSISVAGLDPSFITRLAPESGKSVGLLGRGKLRLDASNRTERGAVVADFTLDAAAVDASGSVRYEPTAIAASNLAVDAELSSEALASLDLGKALGSEVELDPGARISLRAPMVALRKTAPESAWEPAGDLALRLVVEQLRVRRAPGIAAPIAVSKIDAAASYAFADERATANGKATLGASGNDGTIDFRIGWKKPDGARLFAGAEGALDLTGFDLARFESAFGLEQGTYSGILGGPGSLRIEFDERTEPHASIALEFPATRGTISLRAPATGEARTAGVEGSLSADISADAFGRLAGLGGDPSRRVVQPVTVAVRIASATVPLDPAMKPDLAAAAFDISGSVTPITLQTVDSAGRKATLSSGALTLAARSARLADEVSVRIAGRDASGIVSGVASAIDSGSGASAVGALEVDAKVLHPIATAPNAKAAPVVDATVRAMRFPAATVDAFAGTGGAVARYLGDAIDASVDAHGLCSTGGSLSARLSSEFASLEAPSLLIADGLLTVTSDKPLNATFSLSPAVREQLLASIHPVFSDVTTGAPARFSMPSLAWPLDGDRKRLDAAFTLETGDLKLVNSGAVTWMLVLANAGRTDGFDAYLEPLRASIAKGRLTYSDFTLRAGKTAQGSWRNSLVFAGDIDLAAKPIRANSISTAVPLSDAANWWGDARAFFDGLAATNPDLVKNLTVGFEIKGPLFDAAGKPLKPDPKPKLPDIGEVIRKDPGTIIDAAGGILDIINKPKQPKKPKKKADSDGAPPAPPAP